MVELDEQEQGAVERFLSFLAEESSAQTPVGDHRGLARGPEGQILVSATVKGKEPDLHLAMFMAHKAEQIYKQTGCRLELVQRPDQDPEARSYVWNDGVWGTLP